MTTSSKIVFDIDWYLRYNHVVANYRRGMIAIPGVPWSGAEVIARTPPPLSTAHSSSVEHLCLRHPPLAHAASL